MIILVLMVNNWLILMRNYFFMVFLYYSRIYIHSNKYFITYYNNLLHYTGFYFSFVKYFCVLFIKSEYKIKIRLKYSNHSVIIHEWIFLPIYFHMWCRKKKKNIQSYTFHEKLIYVIMSIRIIKKKWLININNIPFIFLSLTFIISLERWTRTWIYNFSKDVTRWYLTRLIKKKKLNDRIIKFLSVIER